MLIEISNRAKHEKVEVELNYLTYQGLCHVSRLSDCVQLDLNYNRHCIYINQWIPRISPKVYRKYIHTQCAVVIKINQSFLRFIFHRKLDRKGLLSGFSCLRWIAHNLFTFFFDSECTNNAQRSCITSR